MDGDYVISKKNFKKYFECNNIIDKKDYLLYKELEKCKETYLKINDGLDNNFHERMHKKIITLLSH